MTLHDGPRAAILPSRREPAPHWARRTLRASVSVSVPVGVGCVVAGLAGSWLVIHLGGGGDVVSSHLFYLPILFAAARFGPLAALVVAVLAGVLAGPLTVAEAAGATEQEIARWVTRAVFFVVIGQLMAWMVWPALPSLRDEVRRLRDQHDLRRAIEDGELFLRYQPIVTAAGDRVVGLEALVRWRHPERGELAPGAFLDTAEQCELIHELGRFVLADACRQAAAWAEVAARANREPWFVSVNLGGSEVAQAELADRVGQAVTSSGLDPRYLCLEITESVLVDDGFGTVEQLHRLKELGVRIAVDDFGTGYSSLAYLRTFPIDVVKLDRSFVAGLEEGRAEAVAGGLVQLCHGLGFQTVAEGVEEPEQGRRMAALDCDLAQGYHYARPMDVDEAFELLLAGPATSLPRAPSEA